MPRKLKVEWKAQNYKDDGSVQTYLARVGELTLWAWEYGFELEWNVPRRHAKRLAYCFELNSFSEAKRAGINALKTHLDWFEWRQAQA